MATIVLAVAGGQIGTGVFAAFMGAAGAAIGGYIDQTLIFPPPEQEGPRFGSQGIQGAAEGEPKVLVYGQDAIRTQGAVIHISDIIEEKSTSGGGCGGGPEITSYSYFAHVAIGICEAGTATRPAIEEVDKIWANGRVIYATEPDVNITASDITLTVLRNVYGGTQPTARHTVWIRLRLTAPYNGTDLTQLESGTDVVMSGWSDTDNNGTFECMSSQSLGASGTQATLWWGLDQMVFWTWPTSWPADHPSDEGPGVSVTLFQDLPQVAPGMADSVTFYDGSQTTPDPILESFEGAGNVPTYAGTAICVIERLSLDPWGNRLPNLEFRVTPDATRTVGSTIGLLAERAGIDSSTEIEASTVTDSLRGFKLRGVSKIDKAILTLMMAYDLQSQEDAGAITITPIGSLTEVSVEAEDLAAHQHGQSTPRDMLTRDVNSAYGSLLPAEVQVSYIDPEWDYQDGMRRHRRASYETTTVKRMRLPLVLQATEAQAIARRVLWTAWAQRQQVEIHLPPSYMHVAEGDILLFTEAGEARRVLVQKVDRGNNFLIKVEGVLDRANTHTHTSSECDADDPENGDDGDGVYLPPHITLRIIDLAPLSEAHVSTPGFYFAYCSSDPGASFPGGSIYESLDGTDFDGIYPLASEVTLGSTTEALGGGVDGDLWDRANTVNVELTHGTLTSATELKVLNGANMAKIGGEIIAFATATLEADGTYTLSTLLRGLRGTEAAIDNHLGPEWFEFLAGGSGILFHTVPTGSLGSTRHYKAVATGNVAADYDAIDHEIELNTITPWPVAGVEFFREVNTDCVISWTRRSRAFVELFGGAEAPLLDSPEVYAMDIMDGATSTRGVLMEAETSYTYTAADQATDWPGGVPATFTVQIFQVSTAIGFGRVKEATG